MDNERLLLNRGLGEGPRKLINYLDQCYKYSPERGDIIFPRDMPYGLAYIEKYGHQWTVAFNEMPKVDLMLHLFSFFYQRDHKFQLLKTLIFKYNSLEPREFHGIIMEEFYDYGKRMGDVIIYVAEENKAANAEEERRINREAAHANQWEQDWQDRHGGD